MARHGQHVVVSRHLQQCDSQRQLVGEIKGRCGLGHDPRLHLRRRHRRSRRVLDHQLHTLIKNARDGLSALTREHRPQHRVSLDHIIKRSSKGLDVKATLECHRA